ncbi:MAG: RES family NAD+ phosphorylase [Alphaproteobacteria bacterium]
MVGLEWPKAHRIIRSVYPPIHLFEDIADPADWELVISGETKTNPRVRDEIGDISLVPPNRRVSGAGASWVMAPFAYVSKARPTRFSDGAYGVYYAGDRFDVALRETIHHFERFLRATSEPVTAEDFRVLVGSITGKFHDIRGNKRFKSCLDPDDYAQSQSLGRLLRDRHGSNGIVYSSVRCREGEAVAAFWPDVVGIPTQTQHLQYHWNGTRVDKYFVYGESTWHLLAT